VVFISPSHWLKAIAERSPLTSSYPTISIPNPVGQLFVSEKTESVINDRKNLAESQSYEVIRLLIVASNLDDPIKNVREVVSQISELSRVTGKVVNLSLVGSGGHEWSSHPSVRLLGRLTQSELTCQYRKTDFLLVPSLGENSPLVIAEAATQGVRAIATNVGGNSELVSTLGDGYIIERVSDLGNLLPNVPWDLEPKSAERLIETSKAVYSPGAVADKYLQTYKKGFEGFFQ
jgi:glycosyltransferase involved in cell wall biosynthesis